MFDVMAVHMLIGVAVLSSGVTTLFVKKGSSQHKKAGRLFVIATIAMVPIIASTAYLAPGTISPLGGLFVVFTAYLVMSAWSTVSQPEGVLGPIDFASPVLGFCLAATCLVMGLEAVSELNKPSGSPPDEAYFFFALLAFVAALLDLNNLRVGGLSGKHRIVRHVWRMSCTLYFATTSVFTGPGADLLFTESMRGSSILKIPEISVFCIAAIWILNLLLSKNSISH